jgi:F-type H+-transporting ATPase subunit epsilon
MVFVPAAQGELGIAPRHAPLLTMLKAGEVRVQTPRRDEQFFYVGGGALEIQPKRVTVLADTALRAKDVDEAAALRRQSNAPKKFSPAKSTNSNKPKRSPNSHAQRHN